jgi:hypothetical protein
MPSFLVLEFVLGWPAKGGGKIGVIAVGTASRGPVSTAKARAAT